MKISRRDFIKVGTRSFVGFIIVASIPALGRRLTRNGGDIEPFTPPHLSEFGLEKRYWGFVCDNEKCIGCGRCVVA
ncbi:MAG: hypothetical protein HY663_04745, partial [Chloroflexi bacterium]|nr:hypothetical protein [Chloroflexota bacterium]